MPSLVPSPHGGTARHRGLPLMPVGLGLPALVTVEALAALAGGGRVQECTLQWIEWTRYGSLRRDVERIGLDGTRCVPTGLDPVLGPDTPLVRRRRVVGAKESKAVGSPCQRSKASDRLGLDALEAYSRHPRLWVPRRYRVDPTVPILVVTADYRDADDLGVDTASGGAVVTWWDRPIDGGRRSDDLRAMAAVLRHGCDDDDASRAAADAAMAALPVLPTGPATAYAAGRMLALALRQAGPRGRLLEDLEAAVSRAAGRPVDVFARYSAAGRALGYLDLRIPVGRREEPVSVLVGSSGNGPAVELATRVPLTGAVPAGLRADPLGAAEPYSAGGAGRVVPTATAWLLDDVPSCLTASGFRDAVIDRIAAAAVALAAAQNVAPFSVARTALAISRTA